jgi:very-short-patch-repair endonuclease
VGSEHTKVHQDAEIARIAARQHGVITLAQLETLGVHRRGLTRRLQADRLHRLHRKVFAVGHRGVSKGGRWLAAVLACGPDAVLSHRSAAWLWGIVRERGEPGDDPRMREPDGGISHVTVPGEGRTRWGIRVHRSRTLDATQTTRRLNIPVTTPSRTLADLRRTLPQPKFAAALRQAEYLRLPIADELGPDRTRSELEARFRAACRRRRLPKPEVNVGIGPFTVDFLWRRQRVIVELDGYRAHGTRSAFEADRARDAELTALGYSVVRSTWRQLTDGPADVASTLRTLLEARQ